MTSAAVEELRANLLCDIHEDRLAAVEQIAELEPLAAVPLLREGMRHWDRELRHACARQLLSKAGPASAKEILSAVARGRLSRKLGVELLAPLRDGAFLRLVAERAVGKHPPSVVTHIHKSLQDVDEYQKVARPFLDKQELERSRLEKQRRRALVAEERVRAKKQRQQELEARRLKRERRSIFDYDGLRKALGLTPQVFGLLVGTWFRDHDAFDAMYTRVEIPKRSGAIRVIHAPSPVLKLGQRALLDQLLAQVRLHPACHGFRVGHSISTNAKPHVNKQVVINLDLRDFFPSVTAARVAGLFRSLDLPGGEAAGRFLVALVSTSGALPQGAPTSPVIANLVCRRLDSRLAGLAKKAKAKYSRYADDITFSGRSEIVSYLPRIRAIIDEEGFEVAAEKTRVLRKGTRQDVTGLSVNSRVSVPRAIRRRLRAAVHSVAQGKEPTWKGTPITRASLAGHLSYLGSVHREEALRLRRQLLAAP